MCTHYYLIHTFVYLIPSGMHCFSWSHVKGRLILLQIIVVELLIKQGIR